MEQSSTTLLSGFSLKYLLEERELPLRNLSQWLFDFIRLRDLRQAKANKVYLKGLDYQYICDLAQTCFTECLVERISPKVFDLIESHRAEGRSIVILSGSLELLVQFFHEHLKANLMIGYTLEVVDGAITGRGVGLNPYGENKAKLVQELAEAHNFDLSESYAPTETTIRMHTSSNGLDTPLPSIPTENYKKSPPPTVGRLNNFIQNNASCYISRRSSFPYSTPYQK